MTGTKNMKKQLLLLALGFWLALGSGAQAAMSVLAHCRTPKDPPSYGPFAFSTLEHILCSSDVISLHCPLTKETRNIINAKTLAAMPVMEGKSLLFKTFGDVDAFPICVDTRDTAKIVELVELMGPTFGGVNLEDIKAPECFVIEDTLKKNGVFKGPIFHGL